MLAAMTVGETAVTGTEPPRGVGAAGEVSGRGVEAEPIDAEFAAARNEEVGGHQRGEHDQHGAGVASSAEHPHHKHRRHRDERQHPQIVNVVPGLGPERRQELQRQDPCLENEEHQEDRPEEGGNGQSHQQQPIDGMPLPQPVVVVVGGPVPDRHQQDRCREHP